MNAENYETIIYLVKFLSLLCLYAVFYRVFGRSKKAAKLLDEQKMPRKAEQDVYTPEQKKAWREMYEEAVSMSEGQGGAEL